MSKLLINWLLFNIIFQIIIFNSNIDYIYYICTCRCKSNYHSDIFSLVLSQIKNKNSDELSLWQLLFLHGNRASFYHMYYNVLLVILTFLYPPQTKFGEVYRNHPVRPSMYLVSATPPKPLIGFLWNFTHL